VIGVNTAVALWSPLLFAPDGLDYMNGAYTLAHGGGMADFVPYKAPGLTVVLGLAMAATAHWATLLHWLHAGLLVAAAGLTWLTARRLLSGNTIGRALSAGAAVLVGTHPVLLTYQSYLLREGASTFLVPLAAWLIVRHIQKRPQGGRGLLSAAALGAVCGAGALYRENFQTLLFLGPVLIAWATLRAAPLRSRWRPAALHAAVVVATSFLVMSPWLFWMHEHYGFWTVTTPKTQFNRCINAWQNGLIDGSEISGLSRGVSDYDYVAKALVVSGTVEPDPNKPFVDVVIDALTHKAGQTSDLCGRLVSTALSRHPGHAAIDMGRSAVSLSGLWNINHPAAHADLWLSTPLRGQATPGNANVIFDPGPILDHSRFTPLKPRFEEMLAQSRVGIDHMVNSRCGAVFNAVFLACEKTRPLLAALFLFGSVAAACRRSPGAVALALLVILNVLGAAVYMMTVVDRFAAPMVPLMIIIGAYGVDWALGSLAKKKAGAAGAAPA
jgi:hypothetical protein